MKLLVMMQVLLCCLFLIGSEITQGVAILTSIFIVATVLSVSIAYFRCNDVTLLVITLVLEVCAAVWLGFMATALLRVGKEMVFTAPLGMYISNLPIFFWLIPTAVAVKLCLLLSGSRTDASTNH